MTTPIRSLIALPFGLSTPASTTPGSVMPQRVVNHVPFARFIRIPAAVSSGITWPPFSGLTGTRTLTVLPRSPFTSWSISKW